MLLHQLLLAMTMWPLCVLVGYYLGRWTPMRFHHCFQEAKCKLESQKNADAVKIAEDLAEARKETIRELQEKLENAENDLLDLRHGLLPDGDSGIHPGGETSDCGSHDGCEHGSGGRAFRGPDDTGAEFRSGVFRFQDPFRGKCGPGPASPVRP